MGQSLSPFGNMDEAERPKEKAFWVDQRVKRLGLPVEIVKGVVSPSLVSLQGCNDLAEEERGCQEILPIKTLGQSEDGNTARVSEQRGEKVFYGSKGESGRR